MNDRSIDVLMITYNRPEYTRLSLTRLLETCDDSMSLWLWHNGTDRATLEVVQALARHPRVRRFEHSSENRKIREPTNWMWSQSTAGYLSKVDDDCLLPDGWAQTLRRAHEEVPSLGVVGCWRFQDEDFRPEIAQPKIHDVGAGHRILRNCWIEGSGYLMKRACFDRHGPLGTEESFTHYCVRLALAGWINGWYYPFIRQEHMDDPRSVHTLLRTDADLQRYMPLSAKTFGVSQLEEWTGALRRDALDVQSASLDPRVHVGWRARIRRAWQRLQKRPRST